MTGRCVAKPLGTCRTTGKGMFPDRATAKRVASHYPAEDTRPYVCQHCGYYHLGHTAGHDRAWHRQRHAQDGGD